VADFRRFQAFTGGKDTWINIETITHMTVSDHADAVIIHFIGGASTSVVGEIGAIIKALAPGVALGREGGMTQDI
jgi:hypothetical protein